MPELLHDDKSFPEKWDSALEMFAPAYLGGITAAKHWGLSEQKSGGIVIMTERRTRARNQALLGVPLVIKHVNPANFFGTKSILIKRRKIKMSDVHRTMIDLLDDPSVGFGVENTSLCFRSYFQRNDRDELKLIEYADQLGNGAVFKRLGFLAEQYGVTLLQKACKQRLTEGTAKLDPTLVSSRLVTRWKLWIPDFWHAAGANHQHA